MPDNTKDPRRVSLLRRCEAYLKRIPVLQGTRTTVRQEIAWLCHAFKTGLWLRWFRFGRSRHTVRRQLPLAWLAAFSLESGPADLREALVARGIRFAEGGHTYYVPPQDQLADKLGEFVNSYPADAGFKILKRMQGPSQANYLSERSGLASSATVGRARDLIPTANFLAQEKMVPQIYDLAQLSAGTVEMTMFVVKHIAGDLPNKAEWLEFIQNIRRLAHDRQIVINTPNWEQHLDFTCPDCSGNLVKSQEGGDVLYVDFQGFLICDYTRYLQKIVKDAKEAVHFGSSHLMRPKRYLYQQIPGITTTGKRDVRLRWERITKTLQEQDVQVGGRIVLDVGCNAGMMLAEALNDGALWGVGWDRPEVIQHTQRLLSALGYTRFSLIGTELSTKSPLEADVPSHLQSHLDKSIVLYLAIRHHVGFIDDLANTAWQYLVYEGAENEADENLQEIIHQLRGLVPCEVIASSEAYDGDTRCRPVVVFARNPVES